MATGKKAMLEITKMKMTPALSAQNISANGISLNGNVNLMIQREIMIQVVNISTLKYVRE